MSITDKHPLPWKVGNVYEYRADVMDANGKLVLMVKPPALVKGVEAMATELVGVMNATQAKVNDAAIEGYVGHLNENKVEADDGGTPAPEEPPNVEADTIDIGTHDDPGRTIQVPRHAKKHRKH